MSRSASTAGTRMRTTGRAASASLQRNGHAATRRRTEQATAVPAGAGWRIDAPGLETRDLRADPWRQVSSVTQREPAELNNSSIVYIAGRPAARTGRWRGLSVPVPLYQAKAEFFRMLGHPLRIRVLELLADGPRPVRDLLAAIEVEPSNLSQQLAVLRRSGIVTATRDGNTVVYALAGGDVAELMRAARRILTELLAGQSELLAELRETDVEQTR